MGVVETELIAQRTAGEEEQSQRQERVETLGAEQRQRAEDLRNLGEELTSARVLPARLQQAGFTFEYPTIGAALAAELPR